MSTNLAISPSYLKTEPEEVVIDPIMSGVALISKRIGDQVYEAFVDSRLVRPNYIQCFPDWPPHMDAQPIPPPPDWRPRTTRTIRVGDYTWIMPAEDFDQLEWVKPNRQAVFRRVDPTVPDASLTDDGTAT